jgi:hypothetical protein
MIAQLLEPLGKNVFAFRSNVRANFVHF